MRKQNNFNRTMRRQSGYTLVQVMLAVTIGALLSIVAISESIDAWNDTKAEQTAREVTVIMSEMVKCGGIKRGSFANCDYDELLRLGYLDGETWGDGTNVNPYGGDYTAGPASGNPNRFVVGATSVVSEEHCARLVEMFTSRSKAVACSSGTLSVTQGNG